MLNRWVLWVIIYDIEQNSKNSVLHESMNYEHIKLDLVISLII